MFLVNSRLGHFSAAPASSSSKLNHRPEHPLSRSYGVNLPSSLTIVISSTLGYSPYLPVSVCGTDDYKTHIEAFLGSLIRASWLARRLVSPSSLGVKTVRIYLNHPPTDLDLHTINRLAFHFCVTP